jgi:hypothetical protein
MDLVLKIICHVAWGFKKNPLSNWVLIIHGYEGPNFFIIILGVTFLWRIT